MERSNPFQLGLEKNAANYEPLTPLSLIERAARVYPRHTSVIHGPRRYTWAQTYERCRRLASALSRLGIGKSTTVAVILCVPRTALGAVASGGQMAPDRLPTRTHKPALGL